MTKWESLVAALDDAKGLRKGNTFTPERLNELGAEGWESVGVTLKARPRRLARGADEADRWA
jgi:hypothetical protein